MEQLKKTREETHSKKWGRYQNQEILPFWIADMDFKSPDFLTQDLIQRVKENYFGYTDIPTSISQDLVAWYKQRHHVRVTPEDIIYSTGVLNSYSAVLQACISNKGKIVVFTPLYPPLMKIAEQNGISVIELTLKQKDNRYLIDFEELEEVIASDSTIEAVVLCNPHNPVGRVWNFEEIQEIRRITESANLYLISDEIHGELVYKDYRLHSVLEGKCKKDERIILLSSPAKTFNVAGIKIAYTITRNADLRDRIQKKFKQLGFSEPSLFAICTLESVYRDIPRSEVWLNELNEKIEKNYYFMERKLDHIPRCRLIKSEGSYLAWIEIKNSRCKDADEMRNILKEIYRMDVHEGTIFRGNSDNYIRLNFGCPQSILEDGLNCLNKAINDGLI